MDWDRLDATVRTAVVFLDRVVDLNFYPTAQAGASNSRWRPVALGVMGLQDVFFRLGLPFDSPAARELSTRIAERIMLTAYETSADLAERHGRHRAWAEAAKSYFAGDFARAADRYEEIGSRTDEAEARLRAAKSLMSSGNVAEGETQLERALGFYRPVGATRFIREGEALLAAPEREASLATTDSRGGPARARSPRRAP